MSKKLKVAIALFLIFVIGGGAYFYYDYNRVDQRNYNPNARIRENKNYVVEIWDLKNPNFFILEEDQQRVWNEIVIKVKEKYPNVELDVKLLSEEEYINKINQGSKRNNMADIVIDWFGTPFMDLHMQIPLSNYLDISDETFLDGTVEYVIHDGVHIGYPLIAKPEVLIGNLKLLEEFEDIIGIAVDGWTFEEFEQLLVKMKAKNIQPVNVMDYMGVFTSSLLVQGDVTSIADRSKLNWYGATMVEMYLALNSFKEQELIGYNPKWLVDFWQGEVGIVAGVDTWLVTETAKRNVKLQNNQIRGAGSTKQINTFMLPYPHKKELSQSYAMSLVSAIPFSQGKYKGEDHTKVVVEVISILSNIYSLENSNPPGFIPAKEELTRQWSQNNGFDDYSNRSVQLSAIKGKPAKSRYFWHIEDEQKVIEKVQPLLDQFWQGKKTLQEFINAISEL